MCPGLVCAILFFSVGLATAAAARAPMTLIELEYGMNHDQIDDGTMPMEMTVVPRDDPTFAQGYFLTKEAEGTENARCLDGRAGIHSFVHACP